MLELELSLIGDPNPALAPLLEAFQAQHHIRVKLRNMTWENAWPELLTFALHDTGPDISHIGSTWAGSLVAMNALRPFTPAEVKAWGGAEVFLDACWQSGMLRDQAQVWALPWTSFTFILCYRRDLLQKAGVDEASAFSSAEALARTLARLQAAGVEIPFVVPSGHLLVDTLHYTASWVWDAGGDLMSADGRQPLFTQPAALAGFEAYFNLFRWLAPAARHLEETQAQDLFAGGQAAVAVIAADAPYAWNESNAAPEVLANLGAAPMPGVPWVGGDNLVIWRHLRASPERERAAVALVNFLAKQSAQQAIAHGPLLLAPTRRDALATLPNPDSLLTQAVTRSLQTGRAYHPVAQWSKLENQLGAALSTVGKDVLAGNEPAAALRQHLDPLARRLEITLGG